MFNNNTHTIKNVVSNLDSTLDLFAICLFCTLFIIIYPAQSQLSTMIRVKT